jgi:hypothetical protein
VANNHRKGRGSKGEQNREKKIQGVIETNREPKKRRNSKKE